MLTRTERRLYGSVERRIDDQRVDAQRPRGAGDRPEVLGVVQPFEHREARAGRSDLGDRRVARRRATATTPRCRSNPTAVAITSFAATYTGTPRSPSVGELGRESLDPRGREQHRADLVARFDQPVDRDEALGHEQFVTLVRPPVRLVVERPVVVEARIVGVGARVHRRRTRHRCRSGSRQCAKTWRVVGERLELEGVARRIEEEHRRLLADLTGEAGVRLDDELDAGRTQAVGELRSSRRGRAGRRSGAPARRRRRPRCGAGHAPSASARRGSRWATNWWP